MKRRRSLYPAASQLTLVCRGRLSRPNSVVVLLLVPVRCCKRDFHIHEAALRQRASGRGGITIRRRRPPQQQQQKSKTEMDGDRDQPIFLAAGGDTTGSVSTARRLLCPGPKGSNRLLDVSEVTVHSSTQRDIEKGYPILADIQKKKNRHRASRHRRLHHHPQFSSPGYPRVMRLQGKKRCAKRARKNMKQWMAAVRAPHSTTTGHLILSPPPLCMWLDLFSLPLPVPGLLPPGRGAETWNLMHLAKQDPHSSFSPGMNASFLSRDIRRLTASNTHHPITHTHLFSPRRHGKENITGNHQGDHQGEREKNTLAPCLPMVCRRGAGRQASGYPIASHPSTVICQFRSSSPLVGPLVRRGRGTEKKTCAAVAASRGLLDVQQQLVT